MANRFDSRPVAVGIDVARVRDDTVVTVFEIPSLVENVDPNVIDPKTGKPATFVRSKGKVRAWLQLTGDNTVEQSQKIKHFLSHFGQVQHGLIDTIGVGAGLYDNLITDLRDGFGPLKYMEPDQTKGPQLLDEWLSLRQAILDQRFEYPGDDIPERHEFERQFSDMIKVPAGDGLKFDHPRREGAKNDYCVSLRLAMKAAGCLYSDVDWEGLDNGFGIDSVAIKR